jgi:spoIIIJ-associated protein
MSEWVEVHGKSIEDAVAAAVEELGLESADDAEVTVLQEPQRGFLGMGGRDAIVRVEKRRKRRRRRGGRGRGRSQDGGRGNGSGERRGSGRSDGGKAEPSGKERQGSRQQGQKPKGQGGKGGKQRSGAQDRRSERGRERERPRSGGRDGRQPRPDRPAREQRDRNRTSEQASSASKKEEEAMMPDPTEQAEVVAAFLEGLLEAFGLDGEVETRVEEDIIFADISGDQTEALIGPKGSILQSILELTRTVVQRKTQSGARLRLDIGGYGERRREALRIYAGRLAEQVVEDGEEVMLEPMNPADRKVVHDVIAEFDGVRSYSEGEEPHRSVVVSPAD